MRITKQNSENRAVGRRKTATARVKISNGSGVMQVNNKELTAYFPIAIWQKKALLPLIVLNKEKDFDISVRVVGGGISSQAEAVRHGIARALVKWNEEFKPVLKAEGLLTRDSRAKERKKFGKRRARRGHQWRKR